MRNNMLEIIMGQTGVAAERIDGFRHCPWSLAVDLFAVHFRIANHVLREHLVEFFAFAIAVELTYLDIDLSHLNHIFA